MAGMKKSSTSFRSRGKRRMAFPYAPFSGCTGPRPVTLQTAKISDRGGLPSDDSIVWVCTARYEYGVGLEAKCCVDKRKSPHRIHEQGATVNDHSCISV